MRIVEDEVEWGAESFSAENAEGERDFFKESGGECEWCKGVVREEDGTATGDAWFCNACIGYTHPSKVRYLKGQPQEGWDAESFGPLTSSSYMTEKNIVPNVAAFDTHFVGDVPLVCDKLFASTSRYIKSPSDT